MTNFTSRFLSCYVGAVDDVAVRLIAFGAGDGYIDARLCAAGDKGIGHIVAVAYKSELEAGKAYLCAHIWS